MFNIQEQLKILPEKPGVYLMKDENENIIYVGKAKNLKNRVKQYFQSNVTHPKTIALVKKIKTFEFIVTNSELEALILECNLIKKFKPKYNILLKYSKSYPYIKITTTEMFPKIIRTNNYKKDGNKYFGPYVDITGMNEVLELIKNLWKIRNCSLKFPKDLYKNRPCLNYHINKCFAPCNGYISVEDYNKTINEILDFMNGNTKEIINNLEKEMLQLSENLEFEKASKIRDTIYSVTKLSQKQIATQNNENDSDIIGIANDDDKALVQIFIIRNGKMIGREQFILEIDILKEKNEILADFINQYYNETTFIPSSIIVKYDIDDLKIIEDRLSNLKELKVTIIKPLIGEKLKLINMATQNATISLSQFGENMSKNFKKTEGAVAEIGKALDLDIKIQRIEAYDISNTSGVMSVGSMIVFENGKPKSADYRKFKIKGVLGPNDYASIEEVITRRFQRYIDEQSLDKNKQKFTTKPDLILIDGGKGQVSSAIKALEKFKINIPVAGMIKDDNHRTNGLIFNNQEIVLKKNSEGFKLLTRIQDEVHRFAIEYHRKLRDKSTIKSVLDNINGVGPKKRQNLLLKFASVENIKNASIEELVKVDGITESLAKEINLFLNNN